MLQRDRSSCWTSVAPGTGGTTEESKTSNLLVRAATKPLKTPASVHVDGRVRVGRWALGRNTSPSPPPPVVTGPPAEAYGFDDPTEPVSAGDADRPRRTFGPRSSLLIGAAGVSLIRWLLAITHRSFTIYFDEPAQLATARTVAGGATWRLFDAPTWQPGFGILLAPLYLFIDDPGTIYRLAIGVNALLGGLAFVLLTLVGCELTGRKVTECAAPAAAISLLPAGIIASAYVWSEQLLIVLVLATMLATMRFIRTPRLATAQAAIVLSACGYLTHGRLLPLIAITTLTVGLVYARARRWRELVLSLCGTAVSFGIVTAISAAIRDRVWTNAQDDNTVSATLAKLRDPLAVLDAAAGQLWYLVVASLGFAVLGTVAAWRLFNAPDKRWPIAVFVAYVLSTAALSALFMSNRTARSDMLIYGRYNEAFLGPVLLVGWFEFVRTVERSRRALIAVVVTITMIAAGFATAVHILHGRDLRTGSTFLAMVPALAALDAAPGTRVIVPTLVALLTLWMLAGLASVCGARSRVVTVAFCLVVSIGVLRIGNAFTFASDAVLSEDEIDLMLEQVPPGETIVLRVIPSDQSILYRPAKQRTRLQLYQFLMPNQSFELDVAGDHPGNYILAPELTTSLATSDAIVLWDDPNSPMALWHVP